MRVLKALAVAEPLTLLGLLANLVTVHDQTVAGVLGPVHGTVYLATVVAVALLEGAPRVARWRAFLPAVGGLLALRRIPPVGSPTPGT